MCGIAGVLGPSATERTIRRMTRALVHRGPDDEGIWVDSEAQLALGHRRLAIIDPSQAGHQPMLSPSGRFVISFNGEIYNHLDLRRQLNSSRQQVQWRGHSDTETLLAGFDSWGIEPTLKRTKGMFALALWDRHERMLVLARDRLGEKPLYFGRQNGPESPFLFASELKAFFEHPSFVPDVDRTALGLYVRYLTVPAPLSIYRGISKLLPGTMLRLQHDALEPVVEEYWSAEQVALEGLKNPLQLSPELAADELERILCSAVGRQMVADVPLGAFLSGGIDSSTIVSVMQKLSPRPVKTFTIGFHDQHYNEADHAKAVARHLGTDHHELYVTPGEALEVIPRLGAMYDEPFADSSQIPTYLISALARQQVGVALSGDGGDELFGGYDRYLMSAGLWNWIAAIPRPLRRLVARALVAVPASQWTRLGERTRAIMPRALRLQRFGDKVHKGAGLLPSRSLDELYDSMISAWEGPDVVIGAPHASCAETFGNDPPGELSGLERMMARDMMFYLPNDILVKVDRAAMAVSLETRIPLLDPDLVEFAWRLPLDMKIRGSTSKWLLRKVLYRHVPEELIDRPKMGFGIPLGSWLRGPLREWAEALLGKQRLSQQGYFDASTVRRAWNGQLEGHAEQDRLWAVLAFQSWLENVSRRPALPDKTPFTPTASAVN